MERIMKKLLLLCFIIFAFGLTQHTNGQFLEKLKKKVEEKVKKEGEKRVDQQINKGVEKVYNEAEKQIAGSGEEKKDSVAKPNDKKVIDSKTTQSTSAQKSSSSSSAQTSEKTEETQVQVQQPSIINSKYDFIPGEKVIFFDDFTSENIGDFPLLWNTTGSGEIVTTNIAEGRWFYITNARGITTLSDPLTLPENYTIEFDVIPQKDQKGGGNTNFNFYLLSTSKPKDLKYGLARPGDSGIKFSFEYNNYVTAYYNDKTTPDIKGQENEPKLKGDKKYRISIWVQKERIRLYLGEDKLFDLPKAISKNFKYNMIRFDNGTPMISNFRVATGMPDMRSKLLTEGKLVSYGIYFDVNKDVVKHESYPSIKEIATILKDNPTVKVKIIGHTDSDGDDKFNLDLSKRRGAAVKSVLINDFGIEASRLQSDGKGESAPVAQNDSATNKSLNRRVEFIKL